MWLWFGLLVALSGAWVNTHVDAWLRLQDVPWTLRARLIVAMRWGLICGVLVYAFLIDSLRIPYSEPGIWAFLLAGMTVTALLALLTHTPR